MACVTEEKLNADFEFYTVGGNLYYRCLRLPFPHAFGTDSGDFDESGLTMLHQIHRTEIYTASSADIGRMYDGYDAIMTVDRSAVIACRTADCVPLLMTDAERGICAAVHAGWKGTIAGISPKVFRRFLHEGSKPEDIIIAVGACARFESYEVGFDFLDAVISAAGREFADRFVRPHPSGKLHADVPGMNIAMLKEAGAFPENIFDCGIDTITDTRFRSYRRQGRREPMLNVISPSAAIPYRNDG